MHAIYIPVLRFALVHEGKMCHKNVLLEYLGEESNIPPAETGCCDVCSSDFELIDYQKEVLIGYYPGCPRNSKLWGAEGEIVSKTCILHCAKE